MTGEFTVAVHALVFLNHKATTLNSDVLAENVCTNPARIRKVMSRMKKAGLVSTKEGAEGGYMMAKPAEEIDLCMVLQAVESPVIPPLWRSGDEGMACLVASGMADIMEDMRQELDDLCCERLREMTIAQIDHKIFG